MCGRIGAVSNANKIVAEYVPFRTPTIGLRRNMCRFERRRLGVVSNQTRFRLTVFEKRGTILGEGLNKQLALLLAYVVSLFSVRYAQTRHIRFAVLVAYFVMVVQ